MHPKSKWNNRVTVEELNLETDLMLYSKHRSKILNPIHTGEKAPKRHSHVFKEAVDE